MQRFFDIMFSVLAIVVLAPFLLPIIIALRFTGEGEVFYKQRRIGYAGKFFDLYKFATMLKDSPNIGTGTVTVKADPRILPMGHFLRKTKINELPQLINILLGDMSVVGPRPQTQHSFDGFPEELKSTIIKVRPGLSGIGSIIFRDEENLLGEAEDPVVLHRDFFMPYKGRLEEWYVHRNNVGTYFLLILLTAWVVISPNSTIVWRAFPDLPAPPEKLAKMLNYPIK